MIDISALDRVELGTPLSALSMPQIEALQRGLAISAYPVGLVDGLIGPRTRNAYAEFVADLGAGNPLVISCDVIHLLQTKTNELNAILARPAHNEDGVKDSIAAAFRFMGLTMREHVAYGLATTQWETAHTFKPVREAFWLSENW